MRKITKDEQDLDALIDTGGFPRSIYKRNLTRKWFLL